ncbi:unnamed protein product [Echinostoma caproni]|uniref:G_PROTEIN_RECEP_F1_2 domain-containing protein n=1 Tax=Echinostoma caproni TaxID=27848 RepID=A0A183AGJ6_9TREM|nr:unnamed protein product [Echinostoma caproni]
MYVKDDIPQLAIVKGVVIWFVAVVGLLANVIGFILMFQVEINFPATRLLLRHQFVCDAVGCVVVLAYWISFYIDVPLALLQGTAFAALWSSYYTFWFVVVLSSATLAMLSLDRFWAVVLFRTYPRDSKYYTTFLMVAIWTYTVLVTSPTAIIAYYTRNPPNYSIILISRVHAVFVLVFAYLTPGIIICLLQVKVIMVLRKLRKINGPDKNNYGRKQSTTDGVDSNVNAISIGIIAMIVTNDFALVRLTELRFTFPIPSYFTIPYAMTKLGIFHNVTKNNSYGDLSATDILDNLFG